MSLTARQSFAMGQWLLLEVVKSRHVATEFAGEPRRRAHRKTGLPPFKISFFPEAVSHLNGNAPSSWLLRDLYVWKLIDSLKNPESHPAQ